MWACGSSRQYVDSLWLRGFMNSKRLALQTLGASRNFYFTHCNFKYLQLMKWHKPGLKRVMDVFNAQIATDYCRDHSNHYKVVDTTTWQLYFVPYWHIFDLNFKALTKTILYNNFSTLLCLKTNWAFPARCHLSVHPFGLRFLNN